MGHLPAGMGHPALPSLHSVAGEFGLGGSGDGYEADRALRILEDQSGLAVIYNGADQMSVRLWNAALNGSLIIAGQLAFLHSSHTDKADYSACILKGQSRADRVRDHGRKLAVRLRNSSVRGGIALREDRTVRARDISTQQQNYTSGDK